LDIQKNNKIISNPGNKDFRLKNFLYYGRTEKNRKITKNRKIMSLIFILGGLLILFVLFLLDPSEYYYYPPCVFKELTGYNCPGCGGMRSLHLLLHGNFLEAFRYNFLIILLTPFILYWIIYEIFLLFDKRLPVPKSPLIITIVFLLIMLLFGILRNLPYDFAKNISPY